MIEAALHIDFLDDLAVFDPFVEAQETFQGTAEVVDDDEASCRAAIDDQRGVVLDPVPFILRGDVLGYRAARDDPRAQGHVQQDLVEYFSSYIVEEDIDTLRTEDATPIGDWYVQACILLGARVQVASSWGSNTR